MVTQVVMPRLSLTMKEGTIGIWFKKEGDRVEKGEPLVEILSEKATYDLEAPGSGILKRILVQEGADVPVNSVLALIALPDESVAHGEAGAQEAVEVEPRVLASPAAKRLAREHGIDLSLVSASGPGGRIIEEDIMSYLDRHDEASPRVKEIIPLTGIRKTSAERLVNSFRTAPHSTVMMKVDASNAKALHEKLGVSFTAVIIKASARSLRESPMINSSFEDNRIKIFGDVNIGFAVATELGLVVPVIRNADLESLERTDKLVAELTEKAKQGKLSRADVTGGTFTVTNLGMHGVDLFIPIINPPEAAILAVGRVAEEIVLVDGEIHTRPTITLSLSYDHRIVDGAPAAEFLNKVRQKVEQIKSGS